MFKTMPPLSSSKQMQPDSLEPMKELITERTIHRNRVQSIFERMENRIIQHRQETSPDERAKLQIQLKGNLQLLQTRYDANMELEKQVVASIADPQSEFLQESDDYEIDVSERKTLIHSYIDSFDTDHSNQIQASADQQTTVHQLPILNSRETFHRSADQHTVHQLPIQNSRETFNRRTVQLPKLELPKFSGNTLEWSSFFDTFRATIHEDTSLSNVQKFAYLRTLLTDEASRAIAGIDLTDANYPSAIELLSDRYGRKQIIVDAHMKGLWEISAPTNDFTSLQTFYDTLETHIRGLNTLGNNEENYGSLLVPMLLRKLPIALQRSLARDRGDDTWDLTTLRKAIHREIKVCSVGIEPSDISLNSEATIATFHTRSNSHAVKRPNPKSRQTYTQRKCVYCKGSHSPLNCDIIKDYETRIQIVKRNKLCFNCLGDHIASMCKSKYYCRECRGKHHTSLHRPSSNPNPNRHITREQVATGNSDVPTINEPEGTTTQVHFSSGETHRNIGPVLFKTAKIPISTRTSGVIQAAVLFDEGANRTFVTEDFAKRLHADTNTTETIDLAAFGSKKKRLTSMKTAIFALHDNTGKKSEIEALLIPEISRDMNNFVTPDLLSLPHLKGLKFAHPVSTQERFDIDMLIGADYYWDFIGDKIIRGTGPTAVSSPFGYLLSGPKHSGRSPTAVKILHVMTEMIPEPPIENYWKLETIGIKDDASLTETAIKKERAYETYRDTCLRRENGHFVAKLPWKSNHSPLPTNYEVTRNRTQSMIRRLPSTLVSVYNSYMQEQVKRDFIEPVPDDDPETGHYLPHRSIKRDSETTPIRVVYDCSCRSGKTSPSLNDCLEKGPPLLNDLTSILIRFRANPIAFTSDVEKAFLQIRLEPDEKKFTKFLWLSDPENIDSKLITYQFKSVLFGAVCSPFILNAVIKTQMEAHPNVPTADDLKRNIYVDDVVAGCTDEIQASQYYAESTRLMETSGFNLRSWSSNSESVRQLARDDGKLKQQQQVGVLGLQWDSHADTLTFNAIKSSDELYITKRSVVSLAASLYDPLGLLSPVHVRAKRFIQTLWKSGMHWDDPLSTQQLKVWKPIATSLDQVSTTTIDRQYFKVLNNTTNKDCELHIFADASTVAFGAVVYIKQNSQTSIVMAKTRVAPVKNQTLTLPRLELMAIVIATRLSKFVEEALKLKYNFTEKTIWSDSQVALGWITNGKLLSVFNQNRVQEINQSTHKFKYVPTDQNPADLLTRGISTMSLKRSHLWWSGPEWLPTRDNWPVPNLFDSTLHVATPEITSVNHMITRESSDINLSELPGTDLVSSEIDSDIPSINKRLEKSLSGNEPETVSMETNFEPIGLQHVINPNTQSSLVRLLNVTSYVHRFIELLKFKAGISTVTPKTGPITAEETTMAETEWIKAIQLQVYGDTLSNLRLRNKRYGPLVQQLDLFLDTEGIVRCGGRLHNAQISYAAKFPALLPKDHHVTTLIIRDEHYRLKHAGTQALVTSIRQRYWIPPYCSHARLSC